MKYNLITILGPTATGKTELGVKVADKLNTEVISADSRQIYRGMDLGTGKDLEEYTVEGRDVPYHLIDIHDAGYKYNVYEYQKDFLDVWEAMTKAKKLPVLCGGTGLYIEAVLKGYRLLEVPVNQELRDELEKLTHLELIEILKSYKELHNKSDIDTKKRTIRSIEIEMYYSMNEKQAFDYPEITPLIIGVEFDREVRRERITKRLKQRLDSGMIEEVKGLLTNGVKPEDLIYYGLEYKFLTQHITGELTYQEMFDKLNVAIHQFAKRQMTWFRRMEKQGMKIEWLDGFMPIDQKVNKVIELYNKHK